MNKHIQLQKARSGTSLITIFLLKPLTKNSLCLDDSRRLAYFRGYPGLLLNAGKT